MTVTILSTICVLGFLVCSVSANCANIVAKPDFQLDRYVGRWYDYMHSPVPFLANRCSYSEYTLNNGAISVRKHFRSNGRRLVKSGTATPQSGNPGRMQVSFPPGGGTLQVIDTDYDDYSVLWTCIQPRPGTPHTNVAWIFSRQPEGPRAATLRRLKVMLRNRYGVNTLLPVNHDNC